VCEYELNKHTEARNKQAQCTQWCDTISYLILKNEKNI